MFLAAGSHHLGESSPREVRETSGEGLRTRNPPTLALVNEVFARASIGNAPPSIALDRSFRLPDAMESPAMQTWKRGIRDSPASRKVCATYALASSGRYGHFVTIASSIQPAHMSMPPWAWCCPTDPPRYQRVM